MRPSLSLPFIALWTSFAYGFSSQQPPGLSWRSLPRQFNSRLTPSAETAPFSPGTFVAVTLLTSRGGAVSPTKSSKQSASSSPIETGSKCPATGAAAVFGSAWGSLGVVYILAKAIKRVFPIALEPFTASAAPLTTFQLGVYIVTCLWFAYVEGYKGFQRKFSPLVVKRSFTLIPGKNGTQWWHYLLAPLYSMGLVHATRKRKIVGWSVTLGVAALVAAVKRLPYPWRNIIDAGVVAGLSWGSLSICILYVKAWMTGLPGPKDVDASLPDSVTGKKNA